MNSSNNFSKSWRKKITPQMFDVRLVNEGGYLDMEKMRKIGGALKRIKNNSQIETRTNTKQPRKKITPQMFDVRLVDEAGDLDMGKIQEKNTARMYDKYIKYEQKNEPLSYVNDAFLDERNPIRKKEKISDNYSDNIQNVFIEFNGNENEEIIEKESAAEEELNILENRGATEYANFIAEQLEKESKNNFDFSNILNSLFYFGKISLAIFCLFFLFNFVSKGMKVKNEGIVQGQMAFTQLAAAKDSMKKGDFKKSSMQFSNAYEKLDQVSTDLDGMGSFLVDVTKYVPFLSEVSSGNNLIKAGKNISEMGILVSDLFQTVEKIKTKNNKDSKISYLELFRDSEEKIKKIAELSADTQKKLEDVNMDDIPSDQREKVIEIKKRLPEINGTLQEFLEGDKLLIDILGGNGPRKYLFLFQNNQEMRATGGFIGSYGLLDIFDGRVRKFFIDGIYNPDGQLKEKVVPPIPIQKISATWSLHDSNWFPSFPKSAEKAAWFYEKTGGPTVDGVIAITPTVMQKLLEITGPIEMSEYGVTVDKDNFIEKIQYEVEIDYDKELNQPKKILSDLAPKVLDRIANSNNFSDISKTINVLVESLNERQILIYSKNWEIEKVLSENGWSGEILDTARDYISVINTNINGFKTDGVILEKISHKAEIQEDGTIIDTLTITRKHNGGDSAYEWWNKVNADYMRVYLPKGSRLLSAEGQTREFNSPPLDYDALGFKRDAQLQIEEDSIEIDNESGTRIYEDNGKTVFANWVYVSPKETVTIKYTYILPFKIDINAGNTTDTYSLLAQKQAGSMGSEFISEIIYPNKCKILWKYPENIDSNVDNLSDNKIGLKIETNLKTNKFFGLAFSEK